MYMYIWVWDIKPLVPGKKKGIGQQKKQGTDFFLASMQQNTLTPKWTQQEQHAEWTHEWWTRRGAIECQKLHETALPTRGWTNTVAVTSKWIQKRKLTELDRPYKYVKAQQHTPELNICRMLHVAWNCFCHRRKGQKQWHRQWNQSKEAGRV